MDRRLFPATDRIAHRSLQGQIAGLPLTDGHMMGIGVGLADLLGAPNGALERQLPFGTAFCVIDRDQGHAFGMADGYCGWLAEGALSDLAAPTHWVASAGTHLYRAPRVQAPGPTALPMLAQVTVTGAENGFAQTPQGYVPANHLRPNGQNLTDPAAVAALLLGAPYLWGGNSRAGVDCSGLVQMALRACGIDAGADSDLQESLGAPIDPAQPLRRNDLIFWRGHVAIVVDETRLIHANGHAMAVAYEDIAACIDRIAAQGPVTHRRRII